MITRLNNKNNNQSGMSALITIVVISAVSLIMVVSSSLLSLGELNLGYGFSQGKKALYLADSCSEEALGKLRQDPDFLASDLVLPVGDNSCIMNITADGNNRTIITSGTSQFYTKNIKIEAEIIDNLLNVISWQEYNLE